MCRVGATKGSATKNGGDDGNGQRHIVDAIVAGRSKGGSCIYATMKTC